MSNLPPLPIPKLRSVPSTAVNIPPPPPPVPDEPRKPSLASSAVDALFGIGKSLVSSMGSQNSAKRSSDAKPRASGINWLKGGGPAEASSGTTPRASGTNWLNGGPAEASSGTNPDNNELNWSEGDNQVDNEGEDGGNQVDNQVDNEGEDDRKGSSTVIKVGTTRPDGTYVSADGREFPPGYHADKAREYDELRAAGKFQEADRLGKKIHNTIRQCSMLGWTSFIEVGKKKCWCNLCYDGGKGPCCCPKKPEDLCKTGGRSRRSCLKEKRCNGDKTQIYVDAYWKCQSKASAERIMECAVQKPKKYYVPGGWNCQSKESADKINACKRKGGTYTSDHGCLGKDDVAKFTGCESNGRGKYVKGSSRYCLCKPPYVWPKIRKPEWLGCQTEETAKKLKECQDKENTCFVRLPDKYGKCKYDDKCVLGAEVSLAVAAREKWPSFFKSVEKKLSIPIVSSLDKILQYIWSKLLDFSCTEYTQMCEKSMQQAIKRASIAAKKGVSLQRVEAPSIRKFLPLIPPLIDKFLNALRGKYNIRLPKDMFRVYVDFLKKDAKGDFINSLINWNSKTNPTTGKAGIGKLAKGLFIANIINGVVKAVNDPGYIDPRFCEVAELKGNCDFPSQCDLELRIQAAALSFLHQADDFVIGAFGALCMGAAPVCAIAATWAWQASGADAALNDKMNDFLFHTMPNLRPFTKYWHKYYRWRDLRWKAKRKR